MATLRETLLAGLNAGREMEHALAAACDDSLPAKPDGWTARDHLSHVAHYWDHVAATLDAVRTGAPVPDHAEADLDERNARIFEANRGLAAAEVVERAEASYERLVRAVERCSDDDLQKPRSPGSDVAVWRLVPLGHVGLHLGYWHLERGDTAAAELTARRVYEIETSSIEDRGHRAAATYDLGCFYATIGRSDEAVALVGQALEQDPDLRDWARRDRDLVSIRHLLGLPSTPDRRRQRPAGCPRAHGRDLLRRAGARPRLMSGGSPYR